MNRTSRSAVSSRLCTRSVSQSAVADRTWTPSRQRRFLGQRCLDHGGNLRPVERHRETREDLRAERRNDLLPRGARHQQHGGHAGPGPAQFGQDREVLVDRRAGTRDDEVERPTAHAAHRVHATRRDLDIEWRQLGLRLEAVERGTIGCRAAGVSPSRKGAGWTGEATPSTTGPPSSTKLATADPCLVAAAAISSRIARDREATRASGSRSKNGAQKNPCATPRSNISRALS